MRLTVLGCYGGIGGLRRTTALLLDDDILIDAVSGAGDLTLERMTLLEHIFLTHGVGCISCTMVRAAHPTICGSRSGFTFFNQRLG